MQFQILAAELKDGNFFVPFQIKIWTSKHPINGAPVYYCILEVKEQLEFGEQNIL